MSISGVSLTRGSASTFFHLLVTRKLQGRPLPMTSPNGGSTCAGSRGGGADWCVCVCFFWGGSGAVGMLEGGGSRGNKGRSGAAATAALGAARFPAW